VVDLYVSHLKATNMFVYLSGKESERVRERGHRHLSCNMTVRNAVSSNTMGWC